MAMEVTPANPDYLYVVVVENGPAACNANIKSSWLWRFDASTQTWTGVPLRDLAALAGVPDPHSALVRSLEQGGAFSQAVLQRNQVLDPDALLALRVNGADLSEDHGYPARIIVPALPGVHCTKWVGSIEFRSEGHA